MRRYEIDHRSDEVYADSGHSKGAHLRRIWRVLAFWTVLLISPLPLRAEIPLPTPLGHYDNFDPETEGLRVLTSLFSELEPSQQSLLLQLVEMPEAGEPKPSRNEVIAALKTVDWTKWRTEVLELLLHRSQVLDIVPEQAGNWLPVVHDALLFFLDHLAEQRLLERLLDQAGLPASAERGERVLQFLSGTPTLQKIGQVLARNPALPDDLSEALQVLENSLRTTSRGQLVEFIVREMGPETVEKYQIHFSDEILAV